jgi:hypothetical protein
MPPDPAASNPRFGANSATAAEVGPDAFGAGPTHLSSELGASG